MTNNLISHSLPTCKFDMELVLWLENLDVKGAVWSEVFHRPCSKDGLVILRKLETESSEINGVAERESVRVQQREKKRKKPIINSAIIIPLKHWLHAATEWSVQHLRVIKYWHFMTGCGKSMERGSSRRLALREILKSQWKEKQEFKAARGCTLTQRRSELKGYLARI